MEDRKEAADKRAAEAERTCAAAVAKAETLEERLQARATEGEGEGTATTVKDLRTQIATLTEHETLLKEHLTVTKDLLDAKNSEVMECE